jgi:hypothetical protein
MSKSKIIALLAEKHTGAHMKKIVRVVGTNSDLFHELADAFTGKDEELARRASWPIGYIAADHPELSKKYIRKFIQLLKQSNRHPSIYRNTFRILQYYPLPQNLKGEVFDISLRFIQNAAHPGSIRAFAMSSALNAGIQYPELIRELKLVLLSLSSEETPAILSRSRKVLQQIDRLEKTPAFNKSRRGKKQ